MANEEMAEEYRKSLKQRLIDNDEFERLEKFDENVEEAFLAGYNKANEWHSPDEHIDKDRIVLGFIKHCNKPRYSLVQWNGEWWYQYGTFNAEVRLIAWCEIPKFKE